jgi:hypothetical protein
MPDQAVIDGLIATYRELNHRVRGAQFGAADSAISDLMLRLRDRELNASQAIKQLLLGNAVVGDDETQAESEFAERTIRPTPQVLLSQFGTAREATLSLVRNLPDEQWNQAFETPRGQMTLRDYLQSLVDRDRQQLQLFDAQLPGAAR